MRARQLRRELERPAPPCHAPPCPTSNKSLLTFNRSSQVEVTVLPPDDSAPRKRSVGRRYSNFVTLYQRVGGWAVPWFPQCRKHGAFRLGRECKSWPALL